MPSVDLGNQFGVALLAVLGALLARRLGLPGRVNAVVPMAASIAIFWAFVEPTGVTALSRGAVAGLLASGMLYILLGLAASDD